MLRLHLALAIALGSLLTLGCWRPPASARIEKLVATFGPVRVLDPEGVFSEIRLNAQHPGDWDAVIVIGDQELPLKGATNAQMESWKSRYVQLGRLNCDFDENGVVSELRFEMDPASGITIRVNEGDQSIVIPSEAAAMKKTAGDRVSFSRTVLESRNEGGWEWPWDSW